MGLWRCRSRREFAGMPEHIVIGDGDDRMDRGDHLAHIPDVRGSNSVVWTPLGHSQAERFVISPKRLAKGLVFTHVGEGILPLQLKPRTRGQSPGLKGDCQLSPGMPLSDKS